MFGHNRRLPCARPARGQQRGSLVPGDGAAGGRWGRAAGEAELSVPSSRPVNLLGLLKWRSQPSLLAGNLQNLMHVDGGEVIKVQ